jgi:hypothetical protein
LVTWIAWLSAVWSIQTLISLSDLVNVAAPDIDAPADPKWHGFRTASQIDRQNSGIADRRHAAGSAEMQGAQTIHCAEAASIAANIISKTGPLQTRIFHTSERTLGTFDHPVVADTFFGW